MVPSLDRGLTLQSVLCYWALGIVLRKSSPQLGAFLIIMRSFTRLKFLNSVLQVGLQVVRQDWGGVKCAVKQVTSVILFQLQRPFR
jgi:hypothetical protein